MIATIKPKTPESVLTKFAGLIHSLQLVRDNYEAIAREIKNKPFQLSVMSIVKTSTQFKNECAVHFELMGGILNEEIDPGLSRQAVVNKNVLQPDARKDLREMNLGEKTLMKSYRELLNEPFLHDNVRQIIRHQQNGLMHCFSQLKMLYALLLKNRTDLF